MAWPGQQRLTVGMKQLGGGVELSEQPDSQGGPGLCMAAMATATVEAPGPRLASPGPAQV